MLEKILQESPEPRWFVDLQLAVSLCLGGGDNVGKEKSGEIPNMNANRKVSVFCLQVIDNNYQKNRVNASTICAIMYNSKKRKN